MRPVAESSRSIDGQPRFEVIRRAADGTEQTMADLAVAVVSVDGEPWLVTPNRVLLRVTAAGGRDVLDYDVMVPPVMFDDLVAWVAGKLSNNEIKLHVDGRTRVVAGGLTAVSSLRFASDGEHLLVVGAGAGGVVGLHVVDVQRGVRQCLTNCEIRVGMPWRNRFVPPPSNLDALELVGDDVSWVVRQHGHVVTRTRRLPDGIATTESVDDEDASAAMLDLTARVVPKPMLFVPPPEFHGKLSLPFRCAGGGLSCAYPQSHVDTQIGAGLQDYNCGGETYEAHTGIDYVETGTVMAVAAAPGKVIHVADGNFDQCTTCNTSGNCSFNAANTVVIHHGLGVGGFYTHLATGSIKVEVGELVTCGQELGEAASSGCSTGPHLHFGTLHNLDYATNGNVYDPYAGPCSPTPTSLWINQGPFGGLPQAVDGCVGVPLCASGSEQWSCYSLLQRKRCVEGEDLVEFCPGGMECDDSTGEAQCVPPPDGTSTTSGMSTTTSDPGTTTSDPGVTTSNASGETSNASGGTSNASDEGAEASDTTSDSPPTSGEETSGNGGGWPLPGAGTDWGDDRGQGCACKASHDGMGSLMAWFFVALVDFGSFKTRRLFDAMRRTSRRRTS